jgi:hypothetical protein
LSSGGDQKDEEWLHSSLTPQWRKQLELDYFREQFSWFGSLLTENKKIIRQNHKSDKILFVLAQRQFAIHNCFYILTKTKKN